MVAAWILVVLALLVTVLAVIAGYVRYQALDTPTVRDTAEEMIADPQIREQIAETSRPGSRRAFLKSRRRSPE
jgi:uncharacterized membrane protein